MNVWRCVEGDCREPAVAWLTFTVDGRPSSFPFCQPHMERVLLRARRRNPGVPVTDMRRRARRWQ